MFNYFRIIFIVSAIVIINLGGPVIAGPVGVVQDNKSSLYAVIDAGNKGKRLYVKGDIFSSDENPGKSLRIARIEKDTLVLEDTVSGDTFTVRQGENIPLEGTGMIFEKTVESSVLEYNYNSPRKKVTKDQLEDFTVKSIEKKKIALEKPYVASPRVKQLSDREKEIFDSPRDQYAGKKDLITELFSKIDSRKIGDNVWTLKRSSAESAIHNAGAALIAAIKRVEPRYRLGEGPSLKFNTDLGTAIVNKEGFLIQNIAVAKLTESFGIKEGDIIKSINGYPVNSLLGIYRAYDNIASDKGAKLLSIDIAREGKTKTLVYKIR